jgi:hypothetical protein
MQMCGRIRRWRRRVGLDYRFRLSINVVRVTALGCHEERTIANAQLINENPLNIFLQLWIDAVRKDRHIPELFVGLSIPRFNVCAATIVIRCYIANTVVNYWLNLWRRSTLGRCQTRNKCDGGKHKSEAGHSRAES